MEYYLLVLLLHICFTYSFNQYLSKGEKMVSGRLGRIYGSFYIELLVGYRGETLFEILNQELQYTYTTSGYFNLFSSGSMEIIRNTTIVINNTAYDGIDINDNLYFQEENIVNRVTFKYINTTFKNYTKDHGGYGLGFAFADEKESLVHQLYLDHIIGNLSYAIVPLKAFNATGRIYFGGVPRKFTEHSSSGACKVSSQSKWSCKLTKVVLTDNNNKDSHIDYVNEAEAVFQAKEPCIIAPKEFVLFLETNLFKEYIKNNTCQVIIFPYSYGLRCLRKIVDELPCISFTFDSAVITIPFHELFAYVLIKGELLIESRIDVDHWVFGTIFLEQIATLFDYNTKTITFYSNDWVTQLESANAYPQKKHLNSCLYLIVFGIMTIGIVIQLAYKRRIVY